MRKYGKYETRPEGVPVKQPKVKSTLLQTYLTSLLCMVLCVTMFFGTSYAWFTSEVENTGNEIYIGILDVELDKKVGEDKWESLSAVANGVNTTTLYTNAVRWEPGYTSVETVRVVDKGDLAFNYELTFTDGKIDGKTEEDLRAAAKWFDVWVYHTADNAIPAAKRYTEITAKDSGWEKVGTLAEVLNGKTVFEGKMDEIDVVGPETAHTYTIALHMNGEQIAEEKEAALNALMGQKIELSVKLVASQRSSEKDSFGDAYYDHTNAVYTAKELQEALDNATGNTEIVLANDITGNVTATQKEGVKITIDGKDHKFNGIITVNGQSARYATAALTIKNVTFHGQVEGADAYIKLGGNDDIRYTNNVTVQDCDFNGTDNKVVAVKSYTGGDYNVTLENLTVNEGMHSLAQLKNVEKNLVVTDCKVYSKNGLNVNNGNNLAMSGCIFDVQGYAVRFGSDDNTTDESFTIENSTLKSACAEAGDAVIEFRKGAVNAKLTLTNTTLVGTTEFSGNTDATTITRN